jgi:hypothetical protein
MNLPKGGTSNKELAARERQVGHTRVHSFAPFTLPTPMLSHKKWHAPVRTDSTLQRAALIRCTVVVSPMLLFTIAAHFGD